MNQFLLPDTIEIFGVTFLINGITLSIAAIPLLWILFVGFYIYRFRTQEQKSKKRQPPLQLSEYSNNFYQYERSFSPGVNPSANRSNGRPDYNHTSNANRSTDFYSEPASPHNTTPSSSQFSGSRTTTSQTGSDNVIDLDIEDIELIPIEGSDGYYADEMTRPVEVPAFILQPIAHLTLIDNDEHLPRTFAIGGDEPVRFGRRKSLSDHVIEDMRISRLHATLIPDEDSISIRDEGSSGGTFVNHQRLGLRDQVVLKDQDIISFNDISYQISWIE